MGTGWATPFSSKFLNIQATNCPQHRQSQGARGSTPSARQPGLHQHPPPEAPRAEVTMPAPHLDEVKREPLTEPKQDRPTKTGMTQDMTPRW